MRYGNVHRNDGSSGCSRFGLAQRSQCDGRRDDAVDAYPVFCRSGTQDGHEIQKTPMEIMNEALVRNSDWHSGPNAMVAAMMRWTPIRSSVEAVRRKAMRYGNVHRNDASSACSRFGLARRSQCDGRRDDAVDAYPVFCRSGTQDGHEIQKTPMEMMNEALVRNSGRKPMRCECNGRRGEAHPVFCRSGIR